MPQISLTIWLLGQGLKHANFLRHMDAPQVRVGLLPSDSGIVSTEGIKFRGLRYTCDTAEREEWFTRTAANTNKWTVTCAYDPNCVDRVFMLGGGVGQFEVCWLTNGFSEFAGWPWGFYEQYRKLDNKKLNAQKTGDEEKRVRAQYHLDKLKERAEAHRRAYGPANVKHMNVAKEIEQQMEAQHQTEEINKLVGFQPEAPAEVPKPLSKVTQDWLSDLNAK